MGDKVLEKLGKVEGKLEAMIDLQKRQNGNVVENRKDIHSGKLDRVEIKKELQHIYRYIDKPLDAVNRLSNKLDESFKAHNEVHENDKKELKNYLKENLQETQIDVQKNTSFRQKSKGAIAVVNFIGIATILSILVSVVAYLIKMF